jgi:hypothetical protein
MTIRLLALSTLFSLFAFHATAQGDLGWRKHVKLAEQLADQSKFSEAADHYMAAYKEKPKRKEFSEKAAAFYVLVKDYKKGAEAYKNLMEAPKEYPTAALRYARMLKQSGQYEAADKAFLDCLTSYQGDDKQTLSQIVQTEIKGCEIFKTLTEEAKNSTVKLEHLPDRVNTVESEFAPVVFSDDIIYFSSNVTGKANIYRTQKQNGVWSKSTLPTGFPSMPVGSVANGSFSPDGKRFYFTVCQATSDLGTRCEIFAIKRRGGTSWSEPIRLRDYINKAGNTQTHPYVTQLGDKEILYFSSNREGGQGGMDIWYATRDVLSESLDFEMPTNLGLGINTLGDEITPYYDATESNLYFSSNGQISLGGYDIYKTKGQEKTWSKVENIGLPYNSSTDDYYFVKNKSKTGGFLTSNRTFGKEKIVTTNEDIFEFLVPPPMLTIRGVIMDKVDKTKIPDVRVVLSEVMGAGQQKRILNSKIFANGEYEFVLLPDKNLRLETEKDGYESVVYEFSTERKDTTTRFEHTLLLPKGAGATTMYVEDLEPEENGKDNSKIVGKDNSKNQNPKNSNSVVDTKGKENTKNATTNVNVRPGNPNGSTSRPVNNSSGGMTSKGNTGNVEQYKMTARTGEELIANAPQLKGTYYKIQLIAVKDFDIHHPRYATVKDLGRLDTEYLVSKYVTRVLLGDFFELPDAQRVLSIVKKDREYKESYLVKYEEGVRVGVAK